MAATETSEILQAIRDMEDDERAEAAELLGPHLPAPEAEFTRRQFAGILAAVAGGTLSVQAALAAVNEGVLPVAAADGVVSDIDTLQSGDGSAISVVNDLVPSSASGANLGSSALPWGAIATEDIDISGLVAGSTFDLIDGFTSDNGGGGVVGKQTDGVSTSATSILTPGVVGGQLGGGLVLVQGDERGSNNRFYDVVLYSAAATAGTNVLGSIIQTTPAGRTYTQDGDALDLAMASGTYDVVTVALFTKRDVNATS